MTLKITRFLTDVFNKQAKISHFASTIKVGAPDSISLKYKDMIKKQFGELFLEDANYVIMTKVNATESDFDKLSKKFVDVVAAVLDTEVAKTEVKTLQTSQPSDDEDADEASDVSSDVILLIKVTTK